MGSTSSPLELNPETMRELGYRVVDVLVERIAGLEGQVAWRGAERDELDRSLREPPPRSGGAFDDLLSQLTGEVLDVAGRIDHPRFFAFIPSCPTWPGILGDFLAGGFNVFQGTWLASGGPSALELVVLDWFKDWIGYPEGASGLLLTGGSEANLTAIACARATRVGPATRDATVYYSNETHSSVERAARVLGFAPDQLRALPVDEAFRLRAATLRAAVAEDLRDGRTPLLVVANAGTTNTGAIDPLEELAAAAGELGLWLHADAAYGGFAALTDRGRGWLKGLELADSVALDPHKWLYQPYAAGCLLVRDGRLLGDAFHVMPDYLQDTAVAGAEVNFADRGIQLTRPARALKLWLSLKYFGVDAFRAAIDHSLDLALHAQRRIEESATLQLLSPAALGVVCFRRDADDDANAALVSRLAASGEGLISSTRLHGRYALRVCVMNHRSREDDVERVLRFFELEPV